MHSILAEAGPKEQARCLLVLLPGAGNRDSSFFDRGFVDAVKSRLLSVDVLAADASIGYYVKGIVWDRLANDVIKPAQARGYEHTWLAGISLGGLGAIIYPREQPGTVDGVFVMAPFLGEEDVINEITTAGGLRKWQAPPRIDPITKDNYQREVWRWLRSVTSGQENGPVLYLGFGSRDRFAPSEQLLAAELEPDHVYENRGAHDWPTWAEEWLKFLDNSEFASMCASAAKG